MWHVIYITIWNYHGLANVKGNGEACATDGTRVARLACGGAGVRRG